MREQFTQAQYTFQLTESKLRSNSLGQVQAHDADLNDTLHYSLLGPASGEPNWSAGQLLRLLELNPLTGQLSLNLSHLRRGDQLNLTSGQFLVQVTDSLGPARGWHTQQARVGLHVAPQIVGRSINFEQANNSKHLFALTTTTAGRSASSSPSPADALPMLDQQATESTVQVEARDLRSAPPSSQRSSLATVMSSLQHMMRSVNFLEMPISSALLLSALLAFLLCLLLIVIVSMSVHVYKRRSRHSARRRHLSATRRLRTCPSPSAP